MGRRGPVRTPTAILKLRGSRRASNRRGEPQADGSRPRRPQYLPQVAKKCWDEILPHLVRLGVLDSIDRNALARYCSCVARWRESEDKIEDEGQVITLTRANGLTAPIVNPWVKIAKDLASELRRLEQEFGMTPAARARIQLESTPDSNDDVFFARERGN